MTEERYKNLMENQKDELTSEEIQSGWHFCNEFDGLLVGPGMGELECCQCGS